MKRLALNLLPTTRTVKSVTQEQAAVPGPISRNTFLYLEPPHDAVEHGQCCECWKWTGHDHETCVILGTSRVPGTASCNLYEYGQPNPVFAGHEQEVYTRDEVGLVDRPVRCENCAAFTADADGEHGQCQLFTKLNVVLPDLFKLDTKVYHAGCCNANTAKQTRP